MVSTLDGMYYMFSFWNRVDLISTYPQYYTNIIRARARQFSKFTNRTSISSD